MMPDAVTDINNLKMLSDLLGHPDRSGKEPGRATEIAVAFFKSRIEEVEWKQREYEKKRYRSTGERGLASDE